MTNNYNLKVTNYLDEKNPKFKELIKSDINEFVYLHTTKNDLARKILEEGFEFEENFLNTTDRIDNKDCVDIKYKSNLRKLYGDSIVIMKINKEIAPWEVHEQIATRIGKSEENTDMFKVHSKYVAGYYNKETNQVVVNENFQNELNKGSFN